MYSFVKIVMVVLLVGHHALSRPVLHERQTGELDSFTCPGTGQRVALGGLSGLSGNVLSACGSGSGSSHKQHDTKPPASGGGSDGDDGAAFAAAPGASSAGRSSSAPPADGASTDANNSNMSVASNNAGKVPFNPDKASKVAARADTGLPFNPPASSRPKNAATKSDAAPTGPAAVAEDYTSAQDEDKPPAFDTERKHTSNAKSKCSGLLSLITCSLPTGSTT